MSRSCGIQLRNSSLSRPQASASMLFSAPQSKTHGSGICSASEDSSATPSASRNSGQTQPTWPSIRALLGRSSLAASATSRGIENHCGADQPNCWA